MGPTRAERRRAHQAAELAAVLVGNHANHAVRLDTCRKCKDEAATARDVEAREYNAALVAWEAGPKVRPLTRFELLRGALSFPVIVVGAIGLFGGFYANLFAGFRTVAFIGDVGLDSALTWLVIGTTVAGVLSLVAGEPDRRIHRPHLAKADDFTYRAVTERYERSRPLRYAEDNRRYEQQWPEDRATSRGPAPLPRRARPAPARIAAVVANWDLPQHHDDLPW